VVGDLFNLSIATETDLNYDTTGAGITWDYLFLTAFPNPVNNAFTIRGLTNDIMTVEIMDLSGKLVKVINNHPTSLPINIMVLSNGIYLLDVSDGNNTYHFKFIKTD